MPGHSQVYWTTNQLLINSWVKRITFLPAIINIYLERNVSGIRILQSSHGNEMGTIFVSINENSFLGGMHFKA